MSAIVPISDEELAAKAFQGDRASFTALYERYFPSVYDLALRLTRSPDRAADIAQDTFFKLLERHESRTQFASFRAWLYTVARHRAIDELRKLKRTDSFGPGEDEEEDQAYYQLVSPEPGPDHIALTKDIAALVWEAAKSLRPDEYALLDMHLRKGLGVEELAQVLGTNKGNVYTMLSRLQDALEGAITALIVARRGSKECRTLAGLVAPKASEMSPRQRRQILRHIETCDTCQQVRRRYVTASQLLAGIAPIIPPASLQQEVLARLIVQLPSPTLAGSGGGTEGQVDVQFGGQMSQGSSAGGSHVPTRARLVAHHSAIEMLIAIPVALGVAIAMLVLAGVVFFNMAGFSSQPTPAIPVSLLNPITTPTRSLLPEPSPILVDTAVPTPPPSTLTPTAPATRSTQATSIPTLFLPASPAATPLPPALPTATPLPSPQIQFWADSTGIMAGQCTGLHWRTQYVQAVYLNGEGVVGNSDRSVCPNTTTSYTLQVQFAGGSTTRQVSLHVTPPTPTPTRTRTPTPSDTVGPSILQVRESTDSMRYGAPGCMGNYFVDIDANMVDPSGISDATLYYRRRGNLTWATKAMSLKTTNWYTARVTSSETGATGSATQALEYYVRARDTRGNASQSSIGTVTLQYCAYVY
jgi:RNA polymerase sigma factor (sigma-70 family)